VEFAYNNKIHAATKTSSFKVNYGQNPRIGFEGRRKGKYKAAGKFVKKMKKIQEEAKAVLEKAQEEMKKFTDKKMREGGGIQSRRLSTIKYEGLEMADEGKEIREVNRTFCGPL